MCRANFLFLFIAGGQPTAKRGRFEVDNNNVDESSDTDTAMDNFLADQMTPSSTSLNNEDELQQ